MRNLNRVPNIVGISYDGQRTRSHRLIIFGSFTLFLQIGTPIASMIASTWFHNQIKGRLAGFLVPRAALFDSSEGQFRPSLGLGTDQFLELAALEHLHHDVGTADEF